MPTKTLHMIFLMMIFASNFTYAGQRELDAELDRASKRGITLTIDDQAKLLVRGYRDRRVNEFEPPVSNTVRPSDFVSNLDRGTIEFNDKWRNYSFHKVKIPDGTVLDGEIMGACNFTQIEPRTDAIDRSTGFGHNLTFKDCNLSNLKTYGDWTIISSNTTQADFFGDIEEDGGVRLEDHTFVSSNSDDIPALRVKPTSKRVRGVDMERLSRD